MVVGMFGNAIPDAAFGAIASVVTEFEFPFPVFSCCMAAPNTVPPYLLMVFDLCLGE